MSLFEYLSYLLDPERNNFQLKQFEKGFKAPDEVEVWTSLPSLLIRNDYSVISEFLGEYYTEDELWV